MIPDSSWPADLDKRAAEDMNDLPPEPPQKTPPTPKERRAAYLLERGRLDEYRAEIGEPPSPKRGPLCPPMEKGRRGPKPLPPRVRAVLIAAANAAGVHVDEIRSDSVRRRAVDARRMAAVELTAMGHSTATVGRYLRRDPTTILYLLGRVKVRRGWRDLEGADLSGEWAI